MRGDWSGSRPARYDLDRILDEHLGQAGGFFIEAGAYDGYFQSNTYSLERMSNWSGVLVEPVPWLAAEAAKERPRATVFNCALVPDDFADETVAIQYAGAMTVVDGARGGDADREWAADAWDGSGSDDWQLAARAFHDAKDGSPTELRVPARTLTSILDEIRAPPIDFMSLDVEGFEGQVLRGLDLERFAPRYILVEVAEEAERRADVDAALGDRYEDLGAITIDDRLYRLRS